MKAFDQWIKSCGIQKGILTGILNGVVTPFLVSLTEVQDGRKLQKDDRLGFMCLRKGVTRQF